ncbi:uncharacterized protein LOC129590974 [Paramacrobiotus metropolitanus]|uniref:uncharacterized protein LOC129590974 n=1 Tax=Paramacrobiotus metropolitanus TaxID=2943436 RepID=UPI002445B195|nr:uncharacterized protein LOC129590974 [Paramacrobiotus metropolitanus]
MPSMTSGQWAWGCALFVAGCLCVLLLPAPATCNKHCDSEVYRCKRGDEVFKYQKKSLCKKTLQSSGVVTIDCHGVRHDCICLDVDSVCAQIGQYASKGSSSSGSMTNSSSGSSSSSSSSSSSDDGTVCPDAYPGDGNSCRSHEQCKPTPGGLALCCEYTCYHVHNLPCVRDFFHRDDQLCTDAMWDKQWHDLGGYPKEV